MLSKEIVKRYVYYTGTISLVIYLVISLFTLCIASFIVKDIDFPKKYPVKFIIETLLMAFIATFPFAYVYWSRRGILMTPLEWSVLILKFTTLHLFFQFSGFYAMLFK